MFAWKDERKDLGLVTVPADEAAQAVFAEFNDEIYAKMLTADKTGDETNYLYGKALENARRVALVLAASRNPDRPVVGGRKEKPRRNGAGIDSGESNVV